VINGTGNALNNTITGNAANNILNGGAGSDAMAGGLGDDIYAVDTAGDTVTEAAAAGYDVVQSTIGLTLSANVERLNLVGTAAINGTGNDLANVITGNAGANILDGGAGADVLVGGAGADRFVLSAASHSPTAATRDVIVDFSQAAGDRIDVSPIDANTTLAGAQAFTFIGTAGFSAAGQLRVAQSGSQTIVSGDVDGDGLADFQIGLSGAIALTAGDFVL
jgi:Ca2+-binding RTX toxin-like protein